MDLGRAGADDPLAQPTRARLFSLLERLRRQAATDELAEQLGLHPNGVRAHLERLAAAGLVTRTRVRRGPGRPRDEWSIAPGAAPGGERPHAYGDLARWLAEAIPPRPGRLREVEAAGRRIGHELAAGSDAPAGVAIGAALASLGFDPAIERETPGRLVCCLGNCPYRESVRVNQDVVCGLHRGMTRGLLDRVARGARLERFEPRDPDTAGCVIEVSGLRDEA